MTDDIIAEQNWPSQIAIKHRGALAELMACAWLLENGYEVFRNVSQHGAIDIIATRGGEVSYFDVKGGINAIGVTANKEQIERGVKFIRVNLNTGECLIADPLPPYEEYGECSECNRQFRRVRRDQAVCSSRCQGRRNGRRQRGMR